MPLPKAPTKMGEVPEGEPNRITQTRKKLIKESSVDSDPRSKKVDVRKLVSLRKNM